MNLVKRFQLLNIAVLAVFSVSGLVAAERPELVKTDQAVVFFKALKGDKYPMLLKLSPAENKMTIILCGTKTANGKVKLAKKACELRDMVAIRNSVKSADGCTQTQIDKKYEGYREAYAAIALTKLLMFAGLYPAEGYNGTVLVDEYVQGLPMKIVLSNMKQFAALKAYLIANFKNSNVVPATQKPLLLLEVLDKEAVLSDSDKAFLNTYFELLDPCNAAVKTFFDNAQKLQYDLMDKTKDAKVVAELFCEAQLRKMEELVSDFDTKKLAGVLTMLVAADIGTSLKKGTGVLGGIVGKTVFFPFFAMDDKGQITGLAENFTRNTAITIASAAALAYVLHVLFSVPEDVEEEAALTEDVAPEQAPVEGAVAA